MNIRAFSLLLLVPLIPTQGASAAEPISVVVEAQAPQLEQHAATELAGMLQRLFKTDVSVGNKAPASATSVVLIGNPETNPAIQQVLGNSWPKLSEQGILIKGSGKQLVVGGGSPVATLWAVYELGHRLGVGYHLRGDIYPKAPIEFDLASLDVKLEPSIRTRGFQLLDTSIVGRESWGLADHKKLLTQLAKLKFNRVTLAIQPWQPFLDYSYRDVQKSTGVLWFGEQLKIDGDTPGRKAFEGDKVFDNPDLAAAGNYADKTAAGVKLIAGVTQAAHDLGMQVALSIAPFECSPEFSKALPDAKAIEGSHGLSLAPDLSQGAMDLRWIAFAKAKLQAVEKTYPQVDSLELRMPSSSPKETDTAMAALRYVTDSLWWQKSKSLSSLELVITGVDASNPKQLDRLIPTGSVALFGADLPVRQLVDRKSDLALVPTHKFRNRMVLTLGDDRLGVLSQSSLTSLAALVGDLNQMGWDGFQARCSILAELDPAFVYLSRAAYDATATPKASVLDFLTTITGKPASADRLWKAMEHMEETTNLFAKNNYGFKFSDRGMLMNQYRPEGLPSWWKEMKDHTTQTTIELYRGRGGAEPRARDLFYYYAKRSEYVGFYVAAVEALRAAEKARKSGDSEALIEQLETAVESMFNAIDAIGDVARDRSDLGLIAILTERAYRPLLAEYERMLDAVEEK
jgi:hypothetical protein